MELADSNAVAVEEKKETKAETPNQATHQMVLRLLGMSKRARELYDKDWNYNYNFVMGKQWGPSRPKSRFSESVNMVWGGIMQETGIETDTEPQTEFVAEEPSDIAFANVMKEINARNWEKYDWNQKFTESKLESKIVHVVHTEVKMNPNLEGGLGDLEHVNLNPFYFYWDPQATTPEDARWLLYTPPTPTRELQVMYPKQDIKSDVEIIGNEAAYGGFSPPTQDPGVDPGSPATGLERQAGGDEPLTKWIRLWIKDDATEEVSEVDKDGKKSFVIKKKYPNGRYIEDINGKIVRDGGPGYWADGTETSEWIEYQLGCMFPISRLVNYAYPRRYAGGDEVTQLKGPQKLFNYTWSYCIDNFKASINPKTVVSHRAGDIADELTSEPNLVIEVPNVEDVKFHYPPGLTPGVSSLVEMAKNMIDVVRGSGEVSGGRIPSNVTSGIFLETSIEIEQTRSRLKARNAKTFLKKLGQIDLLFYLQFYTQKRVFRITSKEGFPQHVEFYISEDKQGQKVANATIRDQNGGLVSQQTMVIKGVPDVRVTVGSALPFAKAIKNDSAKNLYQIGAIDREALYDMIDLPNKDSVLKRIEAKEAQAQQAAMTAGG